MKALVYPILIQQVGKRLQRSTDPAVLLAGGRLAHDPSGTVRHILGVAALLVIAPSALTWLHTVNQVDPRPARQDPAAAAYLVTGVPGSNLDRAAAKVGGVAVRVVTNDPTDAQSTGNLRVKVDCARLAIVLQTSACQTEGDVLTHNASLRLQRLLNSYTPVQLVQSGPTDPSLAKILVPNHNDVENELRAELLNAGPAVSIYGQEELAERRSPMVAWINGGVIILAPMLAGSMVNQAANSQP